jgi:hypothetical protein
MNEEGGRMRIRNPKSEIRTWNLGLRIFILHPSSFILHASALIVAVLLAAGCGGAGKPVKVRGVVTLDGTPLSGATVSFEPSSEGRPAGGVTDKDGVFRLTTYRSEDGALPGEYRVTVALSPESTHPQPKAADRFELMSREGRSPQGKAKAAREAKKYPRPKSVVPPVYGDPKKTPLKEIVPPKEEIKLELHSTMP